MQHSSPLAISVGEPAGIGLEVLLAAWQQHLDGSINPLPPFFLLCDSQLLQTRIRSMGFSFRVDELSERIGLRRDNEHFPVRAIKNNLQGQPAKPHPDDAAGIVEAVKTAVDAVKTGQASGVVTLPINKKSLYDAGFNHPGHTEFLGDLAKDWPGFVAPVKPVMMLAGPELRAVPATIHIPLKDVPAELTTDAVFSTAMVTHRDLKTRFGVDNPRLAISGLNPHAGESGTMGEEELTVIVPAIERLKGEGIDCTGPLPADTMFHTAARATYDAAICMYHDQALIPAKALAFDETVNVTLGLPFIRTSPDHGTAFDIAGTGKANPASLIAAIRMASEMADRIA